MPRPQRIEYNGAWYHVLNKKLGRRPLFRNDENREFFLSLLGEITETYGVEVHAYCFTDSFYHLLLHTPFGNLSTAMRHLNSVYTQHYNRGRKADGSIFRDRYKAVLVDAENYLGKVSRYVDSFPVLTHDVTKPAQYRWSSYRAHIGKVKPPKWLHTEAVLGSFGKRNAADQYKTFVESGVDDEILAFYGKKSQFSILGTSEFVQDAKNLRAGKRPSKRIKRDMKTITKPRLTAILQATADQFSVTRSSLNEEMRGRGGGNTPRAVAMLIARSPGGYSLNEIAKALKVGDISTVSVAVKRMKARLEEEPALAKKVASLRAKLFKD
jgi:putative transposase